MTAPRDSVFRVVDRAVVSEAGFLTLERVRVAGPDGDEFDRHIVLHPGAVGIVPVDDDGDVLLVRQYRVAAGRELLEIPAGKRDVPDEPPELTATRELEEETGRRAGSIEPLGVFYNSPGFTDEYTHVFLATNLASAERGAVTAEEASMTIEHVPLARVDDLIATGEIVDAKSIIGLLLARQRLST